METTIEVDKRGNIHLPTEFGIHPKERILLERIDDMIVIKKTKEEVNDIKEIGNEVVKILKNNMKDAQWEDIEKGREDKEREW